MELNTRGRYAVMAMADLAQNSTDCAVSLPAIGARQQLSVSYLEQIFVHLRQAGLVESARGRAGGYRLARPADEISVADVMEAVSESTRMTRCDVPRSAKGCLGDERCLTHNLWFALGNHIRTFLTDVTLAEIVAGRRWGASGSGQDFVTQPPRETAPKIADVNVNPDAASELKGFAAE